MLGSQMDDPAFTTAAALPLNTWHIQYVGSGYSEAGIQAGGAILFHYKVSGSVPEPGSAGLMVAGALLLRALRPRVRRCGGALITRAVHPDPGQEFH